MAVFVTARYVYRREHVLSDSELSPRSYDDSNGEDDHSEDQGRSWISRLIPFSRR